MSRPEHTYVESPPSTPDSVVGVLSDEGFYGDGDPAWKKAPTAEDAQLQRPKIIKRLKRFAGSFPGAAELAERMTKCRPRQRCMSAACPECLRAYQRWFVSNLTKLGAR